MAKKRHQNQQKPSRHAMKTRGRVVQHDESSSGSGSDSDDDPVVKMHAKGKTTGKLSRGEQIKEQVDRAMARKTQTPKKKKTEQGCEISVLHRRIASCDSATVNERIAIVRDIIRISRLDRQQLKKLTQSELQKAFSVLKPSLFPVYLLQLALEIEHADIIQEIFDQEVFCKSSTLVPILLLRIKRKPATLRGDVNAYMNSGSKKSVDSLKKIIEVKKKDGRSHLIEDLGFNHRMVDSFIMNHQNEANLLLEFMENYKLRGYVNRNMDVLEKAFLDFKTKRRPAGLDQSGIDASTSAAHADDREEEEVDGEGEIETSDEDGDEEE